MTALSVEKRRQLMQSRIAFWQVLREAVAADRALPAQAQIGPKRVVARRAA